MSAIQVCAECHRIMDKTTYAGSGTFKVQVPVPHRNEAGEPCRGVNCEVITAWRGEAGR